MIYTIDWQVDNKGFLQKIQFVNPLSIAIEQSLIARSNISNTVNQTITVKAAIVSLKTIQAKASIKKSRTLMIQALGRILIT